MTKITIIILYSILASTLAYISFSFSLEQVVSAIGGVFMILYFIFICFHFAICFPLFTMVALTHEEALRSLAPISERSVLLFLFLYLLMHFWNIFFVYVLIPIIIIMMTNYDTNIANAFDRYHELMPL